MSQKNEKLESVFSILMLMGKHLERESKNQMVDVRRLHHQCEQLLKLASAELALADVVVESAA